MRGIRYRVEWADEDGEQQASGPMHLERAEALRDRLQRQLRGCIVFPEVSIVADRQQQQPQERLDIEPEKIDPHLTFPSENEFIEWIRERYTLPADTIFGYRRANLAGLPDVFPNQIGLESNGRFNIVAIKNSTDYWEPSYGIISLEYEGIISRKEQGSSL